jgi:hypothetical protein
VGFVKSFHETRELAPVPRPRDPIPQYRAHVSGRGRAVWTDSTSTRHFKLLPGCFDSDESKAAFARLNLELLTAANVAPSSQPSDLSVAELLLAYLEHAARHYREAFSFPFCRASDPSPLTFAT